MTSCIICSKETNGAKSCSKECYRKFMSQRMKGVSGGYREGSGRAKTGYYKGIYCGSTYELIWVIYQLDHNKRFERFPGCVESNGKKYFPDFLQDGRIIEIKGSENQESVDAKTRIANENGYNVIVLRREDLKQEFDYVKSHYNYKQAQELYDDFKPKFVYSCACCGVEFYKHKKSTFAKVYCSRQCSLKGNRVVSGHNQYTKHREAAGVATSPSN